MALDFTALNRISGTDANRKKMDKWIEQGYSIVDGEALPFDDPPAAKPTHAPEKIEIRQIFTPQDTPLLCELNRDGKIELLEKLLIFKNTGAVYAHFMLKLEDAQEQVTEAVQAALDLNLNGV